MAFSDIENGFTYSSKDFSTWYSNKLNSMGNGKSLDF